MEADTRSDGATDGPGRNEQGPDPGDPADGLLDPQDRAIVEALRRDGRRPYGTIAQEVGLSEAAVRRRVQRLRERGIIRIVAVTDPTKFGLRRQALVGVRAEGDVRRVAASLGALAGVERVVVCAGSFDVLVEVACENDDRLLRLVNDAIRSTPGVRSTETFVFLQVTKEAADGGGR